MTKKQVAPKKNTDVAVINYSNDAQLATQFDQDDLTTPFLKVLQKLSPELDSDRPEYVEGAKAGMIINTSTKKVFDAPIVVIICGYERQMLEWVPREEGGGFRGSMDKKEALALPKDDRGRFLHPNGNHVMDTRVWYVLHVTEDGLQPAVIALKSTGIKRSKQLGDIISAVRIGESPNRFRPADWSHTYVMDVTHEQKGNDTWKLPQFSMGELITDPETYLAAGDFAKIVSSGMAKVDYSQDEDAPASSGSTSYSEEDEDF